MSYNKYHKTYKKLITIKKNNKIYNNYKYAQKQYVGGSITSNTTYKNNSNIVISVLSNDQITHFRNFALRKIGTKDIIYKDVYNKLQIKLNKEHNNYNIILYAFVIFYFILEHNFIIKITSKNINILSSIVEIIVDHIKSVKEYTDLINNINVNKCRQLLDQREQLYNFLKQYLSDKYKHIDIAEYVIINCVQKQDLIDVIYINIPTPTQISSNKKTQRSQPHIRLNENIKKKFVNIENKTGNTSHSRLINGKLYNTMQNYKRIGLGSRSTKSKLINSNTKRIINNQNTYTEDQLMVTTKKKK